MTDGSEVEQGCLDEPHIRRALSKRTKVKRNHTESGKSLQPVGANAPLSRLGITLLELSFGVSLQSQELRKSVPSGDMERMRDLFDTTAACE
ncbi:hypothetical protein PpBr36_00172 [Pyricularia pennisetigena]|uniref:hypothetical protein n=1 Tax=Pyricularia pennisetigena TaxID=1578925 RepID=UPI00115413AB|nr:hypothetical protein PpBr36_00172 [Pyricularia pennisetigena]TLS28270.1 hypothetical protein PpBr36_00172 [Pyricularia pennisetigena]